MHTPRSFVVDFIVKGDSPDEMKMVLVEEGDWADADDRLHTLQQRMYDCIDAAIDGKLFELFPETKGRRIIISVDFYNAPFDKAHDFFERFSQNVLLTPSYSEALKSSVFIKGIGFEADFNNLPK
jgi:hypothetical protein